MLPFETANLSAQRIGGAAIARVLTPKVDDRNAGAVRADLERAAGEARGRLVIDLSGVLLLTSAGIGMLIQVRAACAAVDGRLALCGLSEQVLDLLRVPRLEKLLVVRSTAEEALKAVA
jgi:anti-anti-sigma factor